MFAASISITRKLHHVGGGAGGGGWGWGWGWSQYSTSWQFLTEISLIPLTLTAKLNNFLLDRYPVLFIYRINLPPNYPASLKFFTYISCVPKISNGVSTWLGPEIIFVQKAFLVMRRTFEIQKCMSYVKKFCACDETLRVLILTHGWLGFENILNMTIWITNKFKLLKLFDH